MIQIIESLTYPKVANYKAAKANPITTTRYHLWDADTDSPWCATAEYNILDHAPLTAEYWRVISVHILPAANVCGTCQRRKREHAAAVSLIAERQARITTPQQQELFA